MARLEHSRAAGWAEPNVGAYRQEVMRILGGLVVVALLLGGCASSETAADKSAHNAPVSDGPTGPLGVSGLASCVEEYSPRAVVGRGFAFDGTVVKIGDGTTNRSGKGRLRYAGVTFAVDSWFVGGSGATMTIDMAPPGGGTRLEEAPPSYEIGTRLLVSGESRWGEGVLQDGLAWGCGFTRYYDSQTAEEWLDATK